MGQEKLVWGERKQPTNKPTNSKTSWVGWRIAEQCQPLSFGSYWKALLLAWSPHFPGVSAGMWCCLFLSPVCGAKEQCLGGSSLGSIRSIDSTSSPQRAHLSSGEVVVKSLLWKWLRGHRRAWLLLEQPRGWLKDNFKKEILVKDWQVKNTRV